jgi:hypothetical protein
MTHTTVVQLFVYHWEMATSLTEVSVRMGREGFPLSPDTAAKCAASLRLLGVGLKDLLPSDLPDFLDPDAN